MRSGRSAGEGGVRAAAGRLRRLGEWCARHFVVVIVAWLVALAALQVLNRSYGGDYSDDFDLPGVQSTQGLDVLKKHDPAAAWLQQPDRPARQRQDAHLPRLPDVRHGRRPAETAARAVGAEPAHRTFHTAVAVVVPVAAAERRPAVVRPEDGVHHHPLRRAALDPRGRLPRRRGRLGQAAAVGGRRGRVRRAAGRTGPSRARRPGERTHRVRGGDRRPPRRLRQCHRGRSAPGDRAAERDRWPRLSRTARRRLHLRHRLPDPGDDDRPRCGHRLRPVPDHPSPAEPHERRRPGARGRVRRGDQWPRRTRLRLHGHHRPVRAVHVRSELHRETRPRGGGHRGLGGHRRPDPGPGPVGAHRPPHRPLPRAQTGRRDRRRGGRRDRGHLAPLRPARGAPALAVPGRGRHDHRDPRHPGLLHPARPHRRRRRPHLLHRPARLRPDDRRLRPRLQRPPHRRHRPDLRPVVRPPEPPEHRAEEPRRRGGSPRGHPALRHPGRGRPRRHGLLEGVPAERRHHGPGEPPGRRHPARLRLRNQGRGIRHRHHGLPGRLPRHRGEAGCR